jgi:adenosylcobinamide kinase/adenosylcobinamide-phosphate guanylyltransferase
MAARIERHRNRRVGWQTVEEPLELASAMVAASRGGTAVLVDCLTLWLSNLLEAGRDPDCEARDLVAALAQAEGPVVIVSNEVGSGIIPENALARRYADALGTLNQRTAAAVDQVVLVAAGIPVVLKPRRRPEVML